MNTGVRRGRRRIVASVAVAATMLTVCVGATQSFAQDSQQSTVARTVSVPTPLVDYDFSGDDGAGAVANTVKGSAFGAAQVKGADDANKAGTYADGALQMDGDEYVRLPDGLLEGKRSATVSVMVKNATASISDAKWSYMLTLGGTRSGNQGNWAVSTHNGLYTTITPDGNGSNENYFSASENLSTEKYSLLTVTIDGDAKQSTIYINGRVVGQGTFDTLPNQFKAQNWNTIGNSTYPGVGDLLFHGAVKSYTLYDTALSQSQIVSLLDADGVDDLLNGEIDTLSVPATATSDFQVKTATDNAKVVWSSSDDDVIRIDADGTAKVTPSTQQDEKVTLTATLNPNAGINAPPSPITRRFEVNVPKTLSDKEAVKADLAAIEIDNAANMRSNFSVPAEGSNGSTISWTVKNGGTADPKISGKTTQSVTGSYNTVTIGRPAAGAKDTTIVLTATVKHGKETLTKDFRVTVKAMPSAKNANEAYVWVYFTGEDGESQKVSIAASKGNNALDWNNLNTNAEGKAEPILTSAFGEKGLRDPFIMRSHDGDKFYMLATDLKVVNGDFSTAQNKGSKYIEIWESTDLVNWSNQRHVKVSTDYAGNTWAPEAYWDDELGTYVVYWASNMYTTTDTNDRTSLTYNQMFYATTDDFVNFSKPKAWINVDRRGQSGAGSIDATVQKVGDTYYRIYKDEKTMTLREETGKHLTSSIGKDGDTDYAQALKGSDWTEVGTKIGDGQSNGYGGTFSAGEGPSLFRANDGDVNGYRYYLFADQPNYHGGPNHYVPMATTDISDASKWQVVGDKMPEANFPTNSDGGKPRHGTVLPVTRAQYQKVLEAYAPGIAVKSVDAMNAATKTGVAPTLPKTAHLTMADGTQKDVAVEWDEVKAGSYAKPGTFTVKGVAQDDSRMPVEVTVTVSETSSDVASYDGGTLKVSTEGTVVFAEPDAVRGYSRRALLTAPKAGTVGMTDDGVRYDALAAAAGTYKFVVRYASKDGSLADVTYTANVVKDLADATHQRASAHDPSIVKEGDTYYVFGSHRAWLRSKDLKNWESFENNLSTDYAEILAEPWAAWSSQNDNANTDISGNMWAPDVVWNKTMNKWCMYLSLNGGGRNNVQKSMIVLLTADHLDGDWTYVAPVVYSGFRDSDVAATDIGSGEGKVDGVLDADGKVPTRYLSLDDRGVNAIDADVQTDDDGSMWLSYGSWFGGIWMMKLDPATGLRDYATTYGTVKNESDVYYGRKIAGGANNSGEGASYVKRGDYWYLFVSMGQLGVDGGYQIREFRSKNLTGPYTDQNGNSARYGTVIAGSSGSGMNKLVNRGLKVLGSASYNGIAEIRAAQGGNEVYIDDDGSIYNVYHTRFVDRQRNETATGSDNELRVQQMVVSPDGWLVSTPYEYSGAFRQKSSYTVDEVSGSYQIVVNDPTRTYATNTEQVSDESARLADAGIVHAANIDLASDGSVSGQAQGTWSLDGNTVTLHITASTVGNNASGMMGDYALTVCEQPNEVGGYALTLAGVGGNVFTSAGSDVQSAAGKTSVFAAKQTAWPANEDPDDPSGPNDPSQPSNDANGNGSNAQANTESKKESAARTLTSTGSAVAGLAVAALLLAAAGTLTAIRRRRRG